MIRDNPNPRIWRSDDMVIDLANVLSIMTFSPDSGSPKKVLQHIYLMGGAHISVQWNVNKDGLCAPPKSLADAFVAYRSVGL